MSRSLKLLPEEVQLILLDDFFTSCEELIFSAKLGRAGEFYSDDVVRTDCTVALFPGRHVSYFMAVFLGSRLYKKASFR